MAYGNYYPVSYQPIVPNVPAPSQQTNAGLVWVQGDAGAKSYMVAPNNTVLLMDSESDSFYLKSADQSGMPSLRKFSYTEVTQNISAPTGDKDIPYVTKSEYEAFKGKIEGFMREFEPDEQHSSITR